MTIEVKKSIQRVEVYPGIEDAEGEIQDPTIMVVLNVETDDPNDDELPVIATSVKHYSKGDDVSELPPLVSEITSGIWSD